MTAKSVLMVCLGNICRSPLAEAALRNHARRLAMDVEVDSAGTGAWHIGNAPDVRAQDVALRLGGIDVSGLKARQVRAADFTTFDHIIAMDTANLRDLHALATPGTNSKVSLLLDHLPGYEGQPVADPYYGNAADFEACWNLVDQAALAFVERLRRESGFS